MTDKYSLEGVDGNAFSIMAYVSKALKREGLNAKEFLKEAMHSSYDNLICVACEYLDKANKEAENDFEN